MKNWLRQFFHPIDTIKRETDQTVDETIGKVKKEISAAKPIAIAAVIYLVILEIAVIVIAAALVKLAFF